RLSGVLNVWPLFVLNAKKISSLPGVSSSHTTYTLFPSDEICGSSELPVFSSLRLSGVLKVWPLFVLNAKKISELPRVLSSHTTYTLFPSEEICGSSAEGPVVSLRLSGVLNVWPLFVLNAKKMSEFGNVISLHTTYTLFPSDEICGSTEGPVVSLRLSGVLNVWPLFVLNAKKMSELPEGTSAHTTYTLFPSDEICGSTEGPVV